MGRRRGRRRGRGGKLGIVITIEQVKDFIEVVKMKVNHKKD